MRTTKTQTTDEGPVVLDFYRGEGIIPLQARKALYKNSKICGMTRGATQPLQQLRQAIRAQRQAFELLEESLLEFMKTNRRVLEQLEESLIELEFGTTVDEEERSEYPQQGEELLSIQEARQRLGMGKSWVYQRLKSGEIPSVRLGNTFKVKRQDLEAYIRKNQRNQAAG